ncbi:hypothetical protein Focb16_v005946 [Fusarium oxysporum f. sp. cubense]|uniref:Uncharacterized protein n=1 Tax=Fusarium oxysporum f. sp. cubense TaxID=61366 RepID=A0A559LKE1_FUSOC|nr:hypothetical protein Focb16_v005946 [Fusarium oxysporum f. sp. cubense]
MKIPLDIQMNRQDRHFHDAGEQSLAQATQVPLEKYLNREVLEAIWLYSALHRTYIDPEIHLQGIRLSGSEGYKSSQTSGQHIQPVKQSCNIRQCSQEDRSRFNKSNLSIWGCLCLLEHYEKHMPQWLTWPRKYFNTCALIFASQALGHHGYTFPSNIAFDDVASFLNILISLHSDKLGEDGASSPRRTISRNICYPQLVESLTNYCGSEYRMDDPPISDLDLQFIGDSSSCISQLVEVRDRHHFVENPCPGTPEVYSTKLREYTELQRWVSRLGVPDDLSFYDVHRSLQQFPAARTSVEYWKTKKNGDAAVIYIIKCLAFLGYQASMEAILEDPIRMLANINYAFTLKSVGRGPYELPKTPPFSECEGRIAETSREEGSDTGTPTGERGRQTAKVPNECKYEHTRDAICANLTSVGLAFRREMIDAGHCGDDVVEHTTTLLRACYLLFRAQGADAGRACIKCISDKAMRNYHRYGVEWLVSKTESGLPLDPLPDTLNDRIRACEAKLNIRGFSKLHQLHDGTKFMFKTVMPIIKILEFIPKYSLEKRDSDEVHKAPQAQVIYAAACLLELQCSPEEALPHHHLKLFNIIIQEVDRQGRQATMKATH